LLEHVYDYAMIRKHLSSQKANVNRAFRDFQPGYLAQLTSRLSSPDSPHVNRVNARAYAANRGSILGRS